MDALAVSVSLNVLLLALLWATTYRMSRWRYLALDLAREHAPSLYAMLTAGDR